MNEMETLRRRAEAAERTAEVLERKVLELYDGDRSPLFRQLEASRRRRALAELRAVELARYNEKLESEVARRTAAMKGILDHVTFGFLRVDRALCVLPESTRSCTDLFEREGIEGQPIISLLGLDPRHAALFELGVDQVFEDILPEEVSLGQLQQKFPLPGGRILQIEGRVIRGSGGAVETILFTVGDVTALESATRESQNNRALIGILKQREAFQGFLVEMRHQVAQARAEMLGGDQVLVRRVVHTIKGNAGSYGLHGIVELAHEIEEGETIEPPALDALVEAVRDYLLRHLPVLEIDPDRIEDGDHSVSRVPAHRLLGPAAELVDQLAHRLGRRATLSVQGGEILVEVQTMRPVFASLSHLLRNAVDHGIEPPSGRGAKQPTGLITVKLEDRGDHYTMEVEDDGRGIDEVQVRTRALEGGFVMENELAAMTDGGLSMIFLDGFSTAPATTRISGRGVGLSAMRRAVEGVGGAIEVTTRLGTGTRFSLRIPKSAANVV